MSETRKQDKMADADLSAKQRRAKANRRIRKLSKKMDTLVQQTLVYEPGELVMIPHHRGPVVMEVIEPGDGWNMYKVKTVKAGFEFDDSIFQQEARYFEEYTPEADA